MQFLFTKCEGLSCSGIIRDINDLLHFSAVKHGWQWSSSWFRDGRHAEVVTLYYWGIILCAIWANTPSVHAGSAVSLVTPLSHTGRSGSTVDMCSVEYFNYSFMTFDTTHIYLHIKFKLVHPGYSPCSSLEHNVATGLGGDTIPLLTQNHWTITKITVWASFGVILHIGKSYFSPWLICRGQCIIVFHPSLYTIFCMSEILESKMLFFLLLFKFSLRPRSPYPQPGLDTLPMWTECHTKEKYQINETRQVICKWQQIAW